MAGHNREISLLSAIKAFLILTILFLAPCLNHSRPVSPSQIMNAALDSYVTLSRVSLRPSGPRVESTGTGVIVKRGERDYILTSRHLLISKRNERAKQIIVIRRDVEDNKANSFAETIDETNYILTKTETTLNDLDIALLSSRKIASKTPAQAAERDSREGDKVLILGSPYGYATIRSGRVKERYSVPFFRRPYNHFSVATRVQKGFSGGGVFNERAKLSGICVRIRRHKILTIAVSIESIRRGLREKHFRNMI